MDGPTQAPPRGPLVVGVGSALIDILTREEEAFLHGTGAVKGGMVYVDKDHIERTLARAEGPPAVVPGGSACNTVVGVGMLGGQARFVGRCGNGAMGRLFEEELRRRAVEPRLARSTTPTGRVLSIVTPDAERSMFTYLGAAAEIRPEDIRAEDFEGAALVHVEGYLLFNPPVMRAALAAARAAGARISLDLASFNVVAESRGLLGEIVGRHVDILIANEEEAHAYTGLEDPEPAVRALAAEAEIAALKLGPRGSLIARGGELVAVPACRDGDAVVDTTGAGDLWAAGFLHGLTQGWGLAESGALGSRCGYEVCRVLGADIPAEGWRRIRDFMQAQSERRREA